MRADKLLVVIPHAGLELPKEIKKRRLAENINDLIYSEDAETDRASDKLYNLKPILKSKQLIFPYSQIFLNICRDFHDLDSAAPIKIRGAKIYGEEFNPSIKFRKNLINKYTIPFYKKIKKEKKTLILNCHTTIKGHDSLGEESLEEDIVLSDYLELNGEFLRFAPVALVDFYAGELKKRLSNVKIGRNSAYISGYDYICYLFGTDKLGLKDRVPVIHQETEESLYMEGNKVNRKKLDNLRKAFAESIYETMKHFNLL